MTGRWADVGEAARELGISTDAVRKRIARGSLESDRPNGNVLVWLADGGTEAGREAQVDGGPLVEELRGQILYLRSQLDVRAEEIQRRDVIISQLAQATSNLTDRLRELEAPASSPAPSEEPTGGSQTATEDEWRAERERARELQRLLTEAREQLERERGRGFWSRLFGAG